MKKLTIIQYIAVLLLSTVFWGADAFSQEYTASSNKELKSYKSGELKTEDQLRINKAFSHEYVLAYTHVEDDLLYTNDNYSLPVGEREVDNEHITPSNWKWISFEIPDNDGEIIKVHLRRPNWWIKNKNAEKLGQTTFLYLEELGISGLAKVVGFKDSNIDTRVSPFESIGQFTYRPITAWIERSSNDTWDAVFSNGDTIGVTSNHPFYSADKQRYVALNDLDENERILSSDGKEIFFLSKEKRSFYLEKVFNIEVWRDHNYFVGERGLLVHNACAVTDLGNTIKQIQNGKYIPEPGNPLDDVLKVLADLTPSNTYKKFLKEFKDKDGNIDLTIFTTNKIQAWKDLLNLPKSKAWVRKSFPILEKMEGLTGAKRERFIKLYRNLKLPSDRPKPPPFEVTRTMNGFGSVTIKYDDYGFPKFDQFMKNRKILNNDGESVVPNYPGPINGTSGGDLGNATDWALDNFPSSKVRRTPSDPGKPPKKTIDILDDNNNWVTHTWHHHQSGQDLFPVPSTIHNAYMGGFAHSGGDSILGGADNLVGVFSGPNFN